MITAATTPNNILSGKVLSSKPSVLNREHSKLMGNFREQGIVLINGTYGSALPTLSQLLLATITSNLTPPKHSFEPEQLSLKISSTRQKKNIENILKDQESPIGNCGQNQMILPRRILIELSGLCDWTANREWCVEYVLEP